MKENSEKMKNTLSNLIELRLKQCLLILISDLCNITDGAVQYKESVEISEIRQEILTLAKEISPTAKKNESQREEFLEYLTSLRNKISKSTNHITHYFACWGQTLERVLNSSKLLLVKDEPVPNTSCEEILINCEKYLCYTRENKKTDHSRLISCLPVLMPRNSFSDYIKASFNLLYKNTSSDYIKKMNKFYISMFLPFKELDISDQFPDISNKINEVWNMDLSNKTLEELNNLYEEISSLKEPLDNIASDYNMIYNDINFIYLLAKNYDRLQKFFDDDFELKDLYLSACRLDEAEHNELFSDRIRELAEKRTDNVWNMVDRVYNSYNKLFPSDFSSDDEEINSLYKTAREIDIIYFEDILLNNVLSPDDDLIPLKPDDEKFKTVVNSAAEEIVEAAKNCGQYYSPNKLKLAKQFLLARIPCPLSDEQLLNYISNTLDSIKGKPGYLIAINNIIQLLVEEDFLEISDESEEFCECEDEHIHIHHHHHY